MASASPTVTKSSPKGKETLDAYQQAPKKLKDLWKSWTKAKAPFEVPEPSSTKPVSSSTADDALHAEFARFVLEHLSVLFAGDFEALGKFSDEFTSSKSASAFSLENVKLSDESNRKPFTEAEFKEFSNQLIEPLVKSFNLRGVKFDHFTNISKDGAFADSNALTSFSGLVVLPKLFPPIVQQTLLDQLLHYELSNSENQTNFHLHYNLSYPENGASFFSTKPESSSFSPKNLDEHKPMLNRTALEKNLHWVTLGGQYDWTNKVYPEGKPPEFSKTIARLIGHIFTDMVPEAAIINVYSARDKLSVHRDVSEEADRGLVSISLGCACIFIIGLEDKVTRELHQKTLKLESGDVVYMAGESRYAWHGVPKIIPDTTPDYLAYWPGKLYPGWHGWMSKKRINLNIRQMYEQSSTDIDDGVSKSVS
ncbi:hypothetical protein HYALB_00007586 [Hymenoscyphus albidus]|uniref:Fe2OG dioxygenase domain-containing protein n=1 Tax=Hymenoscyphus albidus TaxID=595503 RepID=A0A9N9Q2U6_9HELO|nr:hypothetical protein HYALB_00007586 [Hymenoscyphus albidus]